MSLVRPAIETLGACPIVAVWRRGYDDPVVIGTVTGAATAPSRLSCACDNIDMDYNSPANSGPSPGYRPCLGIAFVSVATK